MALRSTKSWIEDNFWKKFSGEKTLHNVLLFFLQNYPHDDNEYRKKFAIDIIGKNLIGKSLPEKKLLLLLESELLKININALQYVDNKFKEKNSDVLSIFDLDKLSGNEFQEYLGKIIETNGFTNVKVIGTTADQGGDLLAMKNDTQFVIQAKRYSIDRKVNNSAIQEVLGAIAVYSATKGIVATNSFYTHSARNLANINNVELWDRSDIMNFLEKYNANPKIN